MSETRPGRTSAAGGRKATVAAQWRRRLAAVVGGLTLAAGGALAATNTAPAMADMGLAADSSQNIVLEAMRQDLVEHRIDELVAGLNYLKMDLQSNGKLGAEVQVRVEATLGRLKDLKDGRLAKARALLQEAMAKPAQAHSALAEARVQIDLIRRELGSLLLGAGMSHAAEVFADELHDMGARQEALARQTASVATNRTPATAAARAALAEEQKDLAGTLDRLLGEINSLSDYTTTEALSAVRVTRARKALVDGGAAAAMSAAAEAIGTTNAPAALADQKKALDLLRGTEIRLRPEAKLEALVRARNDLEDLRQKQAGLRREAEALRPEEFARASASLSRREEATLRPLGTLGSALEIDDLLQTAARAGADTAARLGAQKRAEALSAAATVEDTLAQAVAKLNDRIADMQKLDDSYRRLQAATNRLRSLEDLRERQAEITDNTDAATLAKKDVLHLADPEHSLADQVAHFIALLPKDTDWAASLASPLASAGAAMTQAEDALRKNQATAAREAQALAFDGMDEAVRMADREVAFLEQFWTLTQLANDLNEVSRYTSDLESEQRDVRVQVEKAAEAHKSVLDATGPQEMLAHAGGELQEVAALISEARQIEPLLADAQQGMAKAAVSLGQDKAAAAMPLQKAAEEQLASTRATALEMAARAEYLTRWIASMEKSAAAGADLLQRQIVLRKKTQASKPRGVAEFEPDQTILKGETEVWTAMEVSGDKYQKAAEAMGLASESLKQVKQADAVTHQKEAEEWLKKALDEMFKWLASLEKMQKAQEEPQELPRLMSVLNRLLLLAMGEGDLRDHTKLAVNPEFPGLATTQDDLKKQLDEALDVLQNREQTSEAGQAIMNEAGARMIDASTALRKTERPKSIEQEILAEASLRKAIAQLMVEAFTPPEDTEDEPEDNAEKPDPDKMETPPPPPNPKGDWRTFLRDAAKGETVAKSKQQWESLSQRDRAALNENFARELPLEYRDILKEYYKTLAK